MRTLRTLRTLRSSEQTARPARSPAPSDRWPRLDTGGGRETADALHLWTQILGKTRLGLCPMTNHWWQVPLYVSARGLGTSPIPAGDGRVFDVELDLVDHRLVMRASDGGVDTMSLCEGPLSAFFGEYLDRLRHLGIEAKIFPGTVEMPERVRLDRDPRLCRYDGDWANRWFRALVEVDRLFKRFRARFAGKVSPVHFFWGGFDLAVTRFSGRPAPPHPGGIPNVADRVMREAYSAEVSSVGFWSGDARFPGAAFYSYAYPEPAGFGEAAAGPAAARYHSSLGEFLLPYEAVRDASDPDAEVLAFAESTYAAAAELGRWDRRALERHDEAS